MMIIKESEKNIAKGVSQFMDKTSSIEKALLLLYCLWYFLDFVCGN